MVPAILWQMTDVNDAQLADGGAQDGPLAGQPRTLVEYLWQQRWRFAPGLGFALLRIATIAPFPLIFKDILDHRMPQKDVVGIVVLAGVMAVLLVVHQHMSVLGAKLLGRAVARMILELRAAILEKIQWLSFGYLDRQQTGRLLSKYAFDTQKIDGIAMPLLNGFIPDSMYSALMLGLMLYLNWKLAAVVLLMIPVIAIMRYRYFARMRKSNEENRLANERMTAAAAEAFGALRLVRSYGQEQSVTTALSAKNEAVAGSRTEMIAVSSAFGAFSFGAGQFLSLVVIAGGATLSIYGQVTAGTVLAFVAGLPGLMQPLQLFTSLSSQYFLGREAYTSLRELLDEPLVEKWAGTGRLEKLSGRIEFDAVSLRYAGAKRDALSGFSLKVEPGEKIALVGASGAGKSTVASILLGLYAPTDGTVRFDGQPMEALDVRWLRRQMAIVMQESVLLSGSIAENLLFAAREGMSDEARDRAMRLAAQRAQAEEFILKLPQGYETVIGERGVMLSGGQRQRISIARAILRDPAILILDEPTSALDYESERLIQQAIDELVQGRTVITIAHRLSTIRNADRVIVMQDGRVVESGTFEGLSEAGGAFAKMLQDGDAGIAG